MRVAALLCCATLLSAQAPPDWRRVDLHSAGRLKADLTFLLSDPLEGRRSLQPGSEIAIQWIASEFAKAGLKPLVGDSYLQPVPIIEYTADRELTSLVLHRGRQAETFTGADATANYPNEVSLSGAVVFAGFGITAPELNYDDYAGIDAKGKIVLIFNHEPQENDDEIRVQRDRQHALQQCQLQGDQRAEARRHRGPHHAGSKPRGSAARDGSGGGRGRTRRTRATGGAAAAHPGGGAGGGRPGNPIVYDYAARLGCAYSRPPGRRHRDVQAAIDVNLAPASFDVPGISVDLRTADVGAAPRQFVQRGGNDRRQRPRAQSRDHHLQRPLRSRRHRPAGNSTTAPTITDRVRSAWWNWRVPSRRIRSSRSARCCSSCSRRRSAGCWERITTRRTRCGRSSTTRAHINFDMIGRNEAADPRVITDDLA